LTFFLDFFGGGEVPWLNFIAEFVFLYGFRFTNQPINLFRRWQKFVFKWRFRRGEVVLGINLPQVTLRLPGAMII